MALEILVNTGSGYGLLPDGTKPLPEPMLTYHQQGSMPFIWGHYHKKIWIYQSVKQDWKFLKSHLDLSGVNELSYIISYFDKTLLCMPVSKMTCVCWTSYNDLMINNVQYFVDIKNNAWVTVNSDFWVTSEAICRWFSRVTKSRVKIIGKSHHEWPKNCHSWLRMY